MKNLPHHYEVAASATADSNVSLTSAGVEAISSAPPAEFGGPGDQWSPETLLAAAVADCFVLTFRAIARSSKLDWTSLQCDVVAVLDRAEGVTRFTEVTERATLRVPAGIDVDKAHRLLEKAEKACLITNSLTAETVLEATVEVGG